jgi:peptide/nickel transport system ATP-binding protein
MTTAWALAGLEKVYRSWTGRSHVALAGASLEIGAGERVAIIGASGSGKSTLVRCGTGLEARDGGTVTVLGEDASRWTARHWARARRRVQVLFQDPRAMLHPDLPIGVLLEESAALHRPDEDRRAVASALLASVGLDGRADALPRELSGGERRRAGIARVMASRPELLIADEPTAGLDAVLKPRMLRLLLEAAGPRCAVVVVTHDVAAVAPVCGRMVVMDQGRVVEAFPTSAVAHGPRPSHPRTRELLDAAGLAS